MVVIRKKLLKPLITIILIPVLIFILFLGTTIITDYNPSKLLILQPENNQQSVMDLDKDFTVTTFNIGYCGLDKTTDFFMDGGVMSRSTKANTEKNLEAISQFIGNQNSDYYLFQEIDRRGKRSYNINQYAAFKSVLKAYSSSFASNYKVLWVPIPITHPYGRVDSGIAVFSKYKINEIKRYDLPGKEQYLRQLFDLDRCISENRIPVSNGKELILVNVHLSAYDKGGTIRNQQVNFLREYIDEQYKNGNYVILGGDWNHLLSADPVKKKEQLGDKWPEWLQLLPKDFPSDGFTWVFDESVTTNRDVAAPYDPEKTISYVIDGFIISPNIELVKVIGSDLKFENSDHNPVTATLKLK